MAHLLAAVAMTANLGCGQKGPLVLPDAQRPHKKVGLPKPAASPAPQQAPAQTPGAPAGSPPATGDAKTDPAPPR